MLTTPVEKVGADMAAEGPAPTLLADRTPYPSDRPHFVVPSGPTTSPQALPPPASTDSTTSSNQASPPPTSTPTAVGTSWFQGLRSRVNVLATVNQKLDSLAKAVDHLSRANVSDNTAPIDPQLEPGSAVHAGAAQSGTGRQSKLPSMGAPQQHKRNSMMLAGRKSVVETLEFFESLVKISKEGEKVHEAQKEARAPKTKLFENLEEELDEPVVPPAAVLTADGRVANDASAASSTASSSASPPRATVEDVRRADGAPPVESRPAATATAALSDGGEVGAAAVVASAREAGAAFSRTVRRSIVTTVSAFEGLYWPAKSAKDSQQRRWCALALRLRRAVRACVRACVCVR